jgi:uncharacterized membrane protein YcaP (DUF421 family)
LRKHGISDAAFKRELREKEIANMAELDTAFLEANGRISVLEKAPHKLTAYPGIFLNSMNVYLRNWIAIQRAEWNGSAR